MLTVAVPKRNKLPNIIVLTPKDGGYVVDLVIDECRGSIEAIIIPKGGKFCGLFGDGAEYIIPFKCIKRIGPDIILVEMHEET